MLHRRDWASFNLTLRNSCSPRQDGKGKLVSVPGGGGKVRFTDQQNKSLTSMIPPDVTDLMTTIWTRLTCRRPLTAAQISIGGMQLMAFTFESIYLFRDSDKHLNVNMSDCSQRLRLIVTSWKYQLENIFVCILNKCKHVGYHILHTCSQNTA